MKAAARSGNWGFSAGRSLADAGWGFRRQSALQLDLTHHLAKPPSHSQFLHEAETMCR